MDNLYSLFYTGQQSPYGPGAWDSRGRKLKHSGSQPFLYGKNKTLSRKNTQNSRDSKDLKLPLIHSRPESRHRYKTNSSSHPSYDYDYDVNKNRNELSNYVKDINNSIALKLQNDNFVAQQKLNNIKHNYNEIKTMLNNKIEKLEQDQQMQFDNLKYALEQGGNLKMMGAVKNANGGNNYDLRRAEEEDMIDATRKLPRLLEDKINLINNMKRKEKQDEKRLLSQVKRKVNEEIQKQKEKDEQRFKKEIDEIEQKRENIRRERKRLMEELQRNDLEESESNTIYTNQQQNMPMTAMPTMQTMAPMPGMYPPQMMPQYPYPPMYPPPMNNNSNNNDSTSEFLKIFLLKKLFDDKPQVAQQAPQMPQFIPYPQPQMAPQIQYQPQQMPQQPISYPQPIIYQSPPQNMNPPNVIIQRERGQPQIIQQPNQQQYKEVVITKSETLNSEKGIPFIDPLEEYLEETKSRKTKTKTRTKTKTKTKTKSKSRTKTKSKSKSKKTTSHKKTTTVKETKKEEEEEEEESTPPPIKLKLVDPENKDSKEVYPKKETKKKETKESKKSKKSKDKDKDKKKKDTKPKKPPKKKKEEEEEDEEEEEEEDDEEEEEEEDDDAQKGKGKKK